MRQGIFISFEGIEGCGKTTQAKMLKSHLEEKGVCVCLTREPGGTKISEQIRRILSSSKNSLLTNRAELFLFLASRAQHVEEVIKPALETGKMVISDRFFDATLAYQGYGRGLDLEQIESLNRSATGGLSPRLTLLFDLDPQIGLMRAKARKLGDERLENETLEFHRRVRDGYLSLAKRFPERIKVVNADAPVAEVFKSVKILVEQLLEAEAKVR